MKYSNSGFSKSFIKKITLLNKFQKSFKGQIEQTILIKPLTKITKRKESHSKVRKIEHHEIKIQKYLQPNTMKMAKEEAHLIF